MARQNDIETIKDRLHLGEITADQANVEMVRSDRFRMVINSLPASVRKALNAAVKTGELGHMKKECHKPECYYHPTFKYLAIEARNRREREIVGASRSVMVTMSELAPLD